LRLTKIETPLRRVSGIVDQFGNVQQGLRRNASAVDANTAGIEFGIDERDLQAEIGREKGRRVPTGTAADNCQLCRYHNEGPLFTTPPDRERVRCRVVRMRDRRASRTTLTPE